ncbi:DUF2844 domain-containing protein [Burkholderia sp. Ac-20379]|uniref:DUF2844 domain-containing protein n=1 Tax=Burkholderia sp. Ac-20379 TaxID=2703900 RepID=UPI001D1FB7CB|nr:DUF2844 domain-containing protein [Burkholderia sp. Ac-20379]
MNSKRMRGLAAKWAAAALAAGTATGAFAALGGAPSAPPAGDTAAVVRTLSPSAAASSKLAASTVAGTGTAQSAAYTVRETTLGSGTVIREYVGANGAVFGVAWQGPTKPDFATIFGDYFSSYSSGVEASHAARGLRAPVAIDSSALVVRSGGHMGAFTGSAWLPQALPAGMSGADIQ